MGMAGFEPESAGLEPAALPDYATSPRTERSTNPADSLPCGANLHEACGTEVPLGRSVHEINGFQLLGLTARTRPISS